MPNIGDVTDTDFATRRARTSDTPVLVDFWAEWCVPCHMVSPVVEEIAREQADALKVAKLNIDDNPETTRKYGVLMSIPTLILFKAGQEEARVMGARGRTPSCARSSRTSRPDRRTPTPATIVAPGPSASRYCAVHEDHPDGDEGHEVRDIQQRLVALGEHLDPAELGRVRPRHGGGRPRVPAAAQPPGRRSRRSDTWNQLVEAGYLLGDRTLYLRTHFRGDDVRSLQRKLNALGFDAGREDGIFGERATGPFGSSSATSRCRRTASWVRRRCTNSNASTPRRSRRVPERCFARPRRCAG